MDNAQEGIMGAMDRQNYGTRAYTVKVSDSGEFVLILNPEGIPASRVYIGFCASLDAAIAEATERAARFNRTILRGDDGR